MLPGEHQQVLSNLQSRFEDFLEDSQESQIFSGSDITQLEKEVNVCKQYYQELLKSAERGKEIGVQCFSPEVFSPDCFLSSEGSQS
jgi:dystonin